MKKKLHGKPLPSKRDIQAQLRFFDLVDRPAEQMIMSVKRIVLTENEITYLKTLLAHEFKEKNDRFLYALCHGSDFMDSDMNALAGIRTKIDDADLSEYVYEGPE
jgi:hypothetical protein